ncbi:CDP-glycerol glycerophosphotransferase family protein [Nitrosophilus kaiyonis]|uniref:CDP-glycerol glycerophosphotransferase family protein n=1 Tax=Nitrosophilus kaiyonis TaxID=2930200 RepID=UPI002490739F|nr:CDP-glycerol glycerophosphotransferase family protein [Nitrosophilus kaiyonis]
MNRKIEKIVKRYINSQIDEDLYLFSTRSGKFSENTKYLFLHYLYNTQKKVYYVLKDLNEYERYKDIYPVIFANDLNSIKYFLKAKYYFITHDIDDIFMFKNEQTQVINLWHGTPLKKMGFDSLIDKKWIDDFENKKVALPWEKWDKFCIAHENIKKPFTSCCHFRNEQLLVTGLPRNDILFNKGQDIEFLSNLKKKILGNNSKKFSKIVLYAPTFRDKEGYYNEKEKIIKIIENFEKKYPNYFLLLRLHPLSLDNIGKIDSNNIINVSNYNDVQELLLISDILISDYSSLIFDYSILKRPILLYPYDLKEYEKIRGFYFDYFKIFKNFGIFKELDELLKGIKKSEKYIDVDFYKRFNMPNSCVKIEMILSEENI